MPIRLPSIMAIRVALDGAPQPGAADAAPSPGLWEEALWLFLPFGLLLHVWLVFRLVRAGRVAVLWLPR